MALNSQIPHENTCTEEESAGEKDAYLAMRIEGIRRRVVTLEAKARGEKNPFAHSGLLRTPRIFMSETSAPWYDVPYTEE